MRITTIGGALDLARDMEETVEAAHSQGADLAEGSELKEALSSLARENAQRQKVLTRLYNDHVYSDMDTGVLAPIRSMEKTAYLLPTRGLASGDDAKILELALGREAELLRLYNDLNDRLRSGPRPIKRKIDLLAREISARITRLEECKRTL